MLYVLQTGLIDYHSHFYQETLGLIAACRDQGIPLKIYANCKALEPILAETGAIPAFRDEPDLLHHVDLGHMYVTNFITMGERFAADCARLEADGVGPDDIIFIPFSRIRHLHGLAKWLEKMPAERRPIIACRFNDPDETWLANDESVELNSDPALTRFGTAEILDLIPGHRFLLFAATARLCNMVVHFTTHRCTRTPIAHTYPPLDEIERLRVSPGQTHVRVCIPGELRTEKGGDMMPDIIATFAARHPGAALSLQVNKTTHEADIRSFLASRRIDMPLTIQVGECGITEHFARLLAADLILLPYKAQRYFARGSGLFADAAACGLPVVVPANTWMSNQIEMGRAAGVSFTAFSVPSIIAAVSIALERLPALSRQARAVQAAWHAEENASKLIRLLMGAVAEGAAAGLR